MLRKRLYIDFTNDSDDQEINNRPRLDYKQSSRQKVLSGNKVLRLERREVTCDVTSGEISGDKVATASCSNSAHGIDTLKPNLICFGSLCDLKLRMSTDQYELKKSGILTGQVDLHLVSLMQKSGQGVLCYNSTPIGVTSVYTSKALAILRGYPAVQYVIDKSSLDLSSWVSAWQKKRKGPDLCLEIILYGDRDFKASLGKALSNARMYLQRPNSLLEGVVLENPHEVQFSDLSDDDSETPDGVEPSFSTSSNSTEIDCSIFLGDLEQSQDFDKAIPASTVKTSLLDHQRRAVNFILHRETDDSHQALSLWLKRPAIREPSSFHVHKITKRPLSRMKEPLGGIIADEMGLGKTLTILASISASREEAASYMRAYKPTKTAPFSSRATLVVVPSTLLLDNWSSEVSRHFRADTLSVYRYHGAQKGRDPKMLADYGIVLTTYATLTAQFSSSQPLHLISWYRIVLDEAHQIRNQNSRSFRAITSLSGRSCWCVTGTPIQNSLDDLGALTRFLQVPCLSTSRDFKVHCINPVLNKGAEGFENIRTLLQLICIRRTKELLDLPKFNAVECRLALSAEEQSRYQEISRAYKDAIDDAICGRNPADAYKYILRALLDLRTVCNYGTRTMPDDMKDYLFLSQDGPIQCAHCAGSISGEVGSEPGLAAILVSCDHVVCGQCVTAALADAKELELGNSIKCPQCSNSLKDTKEKPVIHFMKKSDSQAIEETTTSTKFLAITEDVRKFCRTDKCIIFSFWQRSLEKLAGSLEQANVRFVILEGSLNLSQRRTVLERFQNDADIPVLLMTLGTGAVGLNLTIASRIYLMEPQWNPNVEIQAIGRALRFGQQKQVTIIRYIMKNTVEEYIQLRQRHKLQLADLGLNSNGRDKKDESLERVKDLRDAIGL